MLAYFNQERCQNCGEKVDRDKEIFRIPTWKEQKEGYRAKFEAPGGAVRRGRFFDMYPMF